MPHGRGTAAVLFRGIGSGGIGHLLRLGRAVVIEGTHTVDLMQLGIIFALHDILLVEAI